MILTPAFSIFTGGVRVKANMTSQEFWSWWGSSSPPEAKNREAILNMPGQLKKTGGSNSKGRKKKKPSSLPSERYLLF